MDWNLAIERNREALKRVLAMLFAMAGLAAAPTSPLRGGRRSSDRRVGVIAAPQPPPDASRRPPHKGEVKPALTLPRHLYRTILRLLRPAESAVRRLIIVAARGLVVPPARPRKPKPVTLEPVLRGFGIAVVMSPSDLAVAAAAARRAAIRAERPRILSLSKGSLPLFDPLPDLTGLSKGRRRYVPAYAAPRISGLDLGSPFRPLPQPPSPDDPMDATRLALRLGALASALDDLPGQARRFARWRARRGRAAAGVQDKSQTRRRWPLRPGRPPGQRPARRRTHEVHEILHDLHGLAFDLLEHPDTS